MCCSVCWRLWRGLGLLEVLEVMCCVLLCVLEAVEGGLCLLGELDVLDVLEVVDGGLSEFRGFEILVVAVFALSSITRSGLDSLREVAPPPNF